jgi:hypothetical protein
MSGELLQREQGPIHAWRGHLKGVLGTDRILDIEDAADLPTDNFTVFDHYAIRLFININSQQGMPPLRQELDTPTLIAKSLDYRGHQGLQLF